MARIYDTIINGSGPAGMTAAIYLKRADKNVLILERESCGGQIATAPLVENFPAIESISGGELADKMLSQVLALGVDLELEECLEITKEDKIFHIRTDYNTYDSFSVIVATGAHHKKIGVENEDSYLGRGLSYCVSCDGPFYKGMEVAVIGDANSALQYALELSSYCPVVHLCTLFDKFFADKVLVDRALSKENIKIYHNILLQELRGEDSLKELIFTNTSTNLEFKLAVSGVFIAIGQDPDNSIIKDLAYISKAGYVLSNESMATKTDGLFVAGDCREKNVRQCTTAMADGAIAATACIKFFS